MNEQNITDAVVETFANTHEPRGCAGAGTCWRARHARRSMADGKYAGLCTDARTRNPFHHVGKVETFDITRAWIQGLASESVKGAPEWDRLKAILLKKNPFEEPFFKTTFRMIRIKPQRVSYAKGLGAGFKAEF